MCVLIYFFFFKQKTAYEMRISDWSSDVCSSDLYSQLSLAERCSIARLHEDGQSLRQIAAALDRQPSTIARELKRNSGAKVGYQPAYAQARAEARRWTGARQIGSASCRERVCQDV